MDMEPECVVCRMLMDRVAAAITQQLRAIARLDSARLQQATDTIPGLEAAVSDKELGRENAVEAYREHRRQHARAHGA